MLDNFDEFLKTKTAILVEDDSDTTEVFSRMLGYIMKSVDVARNGKEGLELIHAENPDIVITDIEMPVMNGLELLREIKKTHPQKIVIVVTAFQDEAQQAKEADAVLIKPVLKDDLKKKLQEAFAARH